MYTLLHLFAYMSIYLYFFLYIYIYNVTVLRATGRKNCNSKAFMQTRVVAAKNKTRDYHYEHTTLPKKRGGISEVQIQLRYIGFISQGNAPTRKQTR